MKKLRISVLKISENLCPTWKSVFANRSNQLKITFENLYGELTNPVLFIAFFFFCLQVLSFKANDDTNRRTKPGKPWLTRLLQREDYWQTDEHFGVPYFHYLLRKFASSIESRIETNVLSKSLSETEKECFTTIQLHFFNRRDGGERNGEHAYSIVCFESNK